MTYSEHKQHLKSQEFQINRNKFSYKDFVRWCRTKSDKAFENQIKNTLLQWFSPSAFFEITTSGSTGKPKKIRISKQKMWASAWMSLRYFNLKKGDTVLLVLPAQKIGGVMLLVRAIIGCLKIQYHEPRLNPFENIKINNVHFISLTPSQLAKINAHQKSIIELKKIPKVLLGGSIIPGNLENEIKSFKNQFYHSYGMTETISHVAIKTLNGPYATPDFVALENVHFETNEKDQLIIHAPAILDKALITNDIVHLVDNTHFKWIGRLDNVINSGGIKLNPESIEAKIAALIDKPYYISSVPDKILGEKLVLYIEDDSMKTSKMSALNTQLKSVLSKYEFPKEIKLKPFFKRTENGKIIRD